VLFLAFIYNYLYLHPIYNPIGGVRALEEAWDLLLDNMKAIFRIAEFNLDALNTVDFGPKRHLVLWVNARCGRGSPGRTSLRKSQRWSA